MNQYLKHILITFFCYLAYGTAIYSQTIDSLNREFNKATNDTTRLAIYVQLTEQLALVKPDSSMALSEKAIELAEKNLAKLKGTDKSVIFYKKYLAIALSNLGELLYAKGEIEKAMVRYNGSLKLQEEINDKIGIAYTYNNIGVVHKNQGDIAKALDFYSKSLKIFEEENFAIGIGFTLTNIGLIYHSQGDVDKALAYYLKANVYKEKIGDVRGIALSMNNIAGIYFSINKIDSAIFYFNKALELYTSIEDYRSIARTYNSLGRTFQIQKNTKKAFEYYNKSLALSEKIGDKNGLINANLSLGYLLKEQKKYKEAIKYCNISMALSKEIGFPEKIKNVASMLNQLYRSIGDYKSALENYELHILMRDSINNLETQKATIKQETQYEYEKKKAIADKEHDLELKQQKEKSQAEKTKQNIIIGSVSIVLLLVAVFSLFLYNRFKVTQKQKSIIELKEKETHLQKELIELKHKEITDSINYAQRIQRSFLATKELLNDNLGVTSVTNEGGALINEPNYFVLFKPKDIVSGDFYWASILKNGNFALATADSTGHGVPGAIMSLLNITSLEKAIETTSNPAEILNITRKIIIERLKKDGSAEGGKDGMDCSLISFNKNKTKLEIACAHNPVWIMSTNSAVEHKKVIEIKADKMPVGKHESDKESFTFHEIDIQKGDVIYTLTDGFSDQFGGPKGKKYMSKNLRELLASNAHLPMQQQKQILEDTFNSHKGNLEQVDDVCVIGIRI